MAQKMLNIEVGEKFIKVCVSQGTAKNYKILKGFQFEYLGSVVNDGQITDVSSLGEQIKVGLEENGVSDVRKVTFVFSSTKVPVREVSVPPARNDRIGALIQTNASEYFPVDISNYHVTHTILERIQKPEPALRVLVTAVPLVLLKGYFELAAFLNLEVVAVDYSPNSQYQILSSFEEEGVVMYLSVNLHSTTATFLQNGNFLLQRNVPIGGDELVTAAMRYAGAQSSQYVQVLEQCTNTNWLETALPAENRLAAMGRLISGIGRILEFFRSNQKGMPIDKIVLLGVSANLYGLKEAIEQATAIPTEILTAIPKHEKSIVALEGSIVSYISCIGSLLAPLDLMPLEMKKGAANEKKDNLTASILVCTLAVVAGLGLSATALIENIALNSELDSINTQIEELQYVVDTYNTYVEYEAMNQNLKVFNANANNKNEGLTIFLTELEKAVPSNILMMSAICSNTGVTINATVSNFEEVAVTLANLRKFESIEILSISGATESVNEVGASNVSFSVTATYTVPPVEEVALPQPILQDTSSAQVTE